MDIVRNNQATVVSVSMVAALTDARGNERAQTTRSHRLGAKRLARSRTQRNFQISNCVSNAERVCTFAPRK